MPLEDAVERAINECIREGILADFLSKNKAEAKKMSIYEYDEEETMRQLREESFEEGKAAEREKDINILIRTLLEFEVTKEKIVSKVCEEYSIEQDEAERLVGECS